MRDQALVDRVVRFRLDFFVVVLRDAVLAEDVFLVVFFAPDFAEELDGLFDVFFDVVFDVVLDVVLLDVPAPDAEVVFFREEAFRLDVFLVVVLPPALAGDGLRAERGGPA